MIDYEKFCKLKMLHQCKLSAVQIAEACSLNEKTVRKYLKVDQLSPRKPTARSSKLDPFKKQIVAMLERHPYSSMQIFHQLKQDGYTGEYSIVNTYVRKARPPKRPAYLT